MSRVDWEEQVYQQVELQAEVTRSDAQGIARDELVEFAYQHAMPPDLAAQFILSSVSVS